MNEKNIVDEAAEEVKGMAENLKKMKEDMEAKMEEILKEQANLNKAMIRSNEEEKETGRGYGFLQAKKDVAMGKTAMVPYWDDKTTKRFNEFLQMKYQKDYKGIQKAFGDNVQDNISNWTPTEFSSEVVRLAYQASIALQKCTIVPMSRDKIELPAPSGNYTVSWISAGSAMTDSKITAGKVSLDTAKLGGIAVVNSEDLEDSAYPVAPFVAAQMGEDFGKKIDEEVFQGDVVGDASNHAFAGWEYAASVQSVAGGVDATPTFAELLTENNLLEACGLLDDLQVEGAEWYFIPRAWNAIRKLEDGANSKIVRLNENYMYELLGYPVNRRAQVGTSASATAGVASRAAGFFGNLKWIYIGDRMDFTVDTSEHYRFANDQIVFRGLQRLAIAVGLPTALVKVVFGAAA